VVHFSIYKTLALEPFMKLLSPVRNFVYSSFKMYFNVLDFKLSPCSVCCMFSYNILILSAHVSQYLSGVPFTFLEHHFICTYLIFHSSCSCNISHPPNILLFVVSRNKLMNTSLRKDDEISFFYWM